MPQVVSLQESTFACKTSLGCQVRDRLKRNAAHRLCGTVSSRKWINNYLLLLTIALSHYLTISHYLTYALTH